ncbi:MAG: arabinogalactan endo-1,4-beta-galactosidase [Muribaculaceae bacterium]|nr:arabinogalactan endo-1,4-beta-galactosidase [Muribaculaceae bacterium]
MKRLTLSLIFTFVFSAILMAGCSDHSTHHDIPNPGSKPGGSEITTSTYAKGADVSWLTQLEKEGHKFYDTNGKETELMKLLKDECGVNAIRLRVWVNPAEGWNNVADVMTKARRAHDLGMRIMIDFHFSDTWADPGHQPTPEAWKNFDVDGLKQAMTQHVDEMLSALKTEGITPEWVQVGNETTQGMLWPVGKDDRPADFAALVNAGYDAVKSIFPDAKVIVHLDKGNDLWRYDHIFGILTEHGGKYDMIGMSLYPEPDAWLKDTDTMIENIKTLHTRYGKPVVICEVGMRYDLGDTADRMISRIKDNTQSLGYVDGIFYWEPEAPAGYNGGYDKGCFIDGRPTNALNSFKN